MSIAQLEREGVVFFSSSLLPVPHGFSTRLGGVSTGDFSSLNLGLRRGDDPEAVEENYRRFQRAAGLDGGLVTLNQVHGDAIFSVTSASCKKTLLSPAAGDGDGLMTDEPGVVLTVFSADCIPVLLCDPVKKAIAAVHSGWRGTSLGIAGKAVSAMAERFGSDPRDIAAAIGPGIGPCCFETHSDVPQAMERSFGAAARPFFGPDGCGKFHVDLKSIIRMTLVASGVSGERIDLSGACTACDERLFWSHRTMGNRRGSMAAAIMLPVPSAQPKPKL